MDILRKKIKGASILESLVAMTIILLSVTLTGVVYSGFSSQTGGLKNVLLQNRCEQIFNQVAANAVVNEKTIEKHDNYQFEIQTASYMNSDKVIQVKIQVTDDTKSKKLFEFNRLTVKRQHETSLTDS